MKFLTDDLLYVSTEHCLRYLRQVDDHDQLDEGADRHAALQPDRYHMYWRGPFGPKPALAISSFIATQHLPSVELWLWLDRESGYDGHEEDPHLRPLLPHLTVRRFDPETAALETPLAGRPELYQLWPVKRSDFARVVLLYRHGGTYVDLDVLFLRDMRLLKSVPGWSDEFCYQWARHPYANTAVLRLQQGSATAQALAERCVERRSCHPRDLTPFDDEQLDLLVLPSTFFDPLWLHHERKDTYPAAPFARFPDFFAPIPASTSPQTSLDADADPDRDFFPGAFTYHWHNGWQQPEIDNSWFGQLRARFDRRLAAVHSATVP